MGLCPGTAGRAPHRVRAAAGKMCVAPLLGRRSAGCGRLGVGPGAEPAHHPGVSVRHLHFQLSGWVLRLFAAAGHGRAGPPGTDFVRCGRRAGAGLPLAQLGQELRRGSQREQPPGHRLRLGGLPGCLWRHEALGRPHRACGRVPGAAQFWAVRLPLSGAVGGGLWAGVLPALARRGGIPAVRRSCLRRRAGAVCRAAPCAGGAVLCFRH